MKNNNSKLEKITEDDLEKVAGGIDSEPVSTDKDDSSDTMFDRPEIDIPYTRWPPHHI